MTTPKPQPGILDIALYQGGKSALAGHANPLKLSSNENPLGPPPSAIAAITSAAGQSHLYPPTDHADLRAAIGDVWGLDPGRVICGVGSDEVLQFVVHAYAGEGDEVLYTQHGFSMYPILARMVGARPVTVPETERRVDVDAVLAGITKATRVIFITNPGNPTGTRLDQAELERLAQGVPSHVMLVLDGAYAEYADGFDGGVALVDAYPNVLMTRTFSKIYGLGGLRIGWGYGARDVIDVLNRVRQPFNLSGVQLAAAEAAARDTDWLDDCVALNAEQRARLVSAVRQLGFACDDSEANFVLVRFADETQADRAEAALTAAGIIVRRVTGYGFPQGIRITVGDAAGTTRVIDALTDWSQDSV